MRDGANRRPGAVPDDVASGGHDVHLAGADVRWGTDTDGDGRPDTLLTDDGPDLLVLTDLDADGLADRVVRIGPDGAVRTDGYVDPHPDGHGHATGSAHATPALWSAFLRLCGLAP